MAHSPVPAHSLPDDGRAGPSVTADEDASRRARLKDAWRRAQRGWPARYPIAQMPNAPLVVALSGWLVAELVDGSPQPYARAVFYVGISAWGWGELTGGLSSFRRALGAAALTYVVVEVASAVAPA